MEDIGISLTDGRQVAVDDASPKSAVVSAGRRRRHVALELWSERVRRCPRVADETFDEQRVRPGGDQRHRTDGVGKTIVGQRVSVRVD